MVHVVHADLSEVAFLLGTWRGTGEGEWPRGEPFSYAEEMTFEEIGDAFLLYAQRSWTIEDEMPIHLERGFLRPAGHGRVELVLAHPLGVAEVAEGTVRDGVVEVGTTAVALTGTAAPVTELARRLELHGDELRCELRMAMHDIGLVSHVRSRLTRA
jgi:hypothetical protein